MSEFGKKLRMIREDRGLTQEELGAKLQTSRQVISRYETSLRSPKISVVVELARALDVDLSFFDDSENRSSGQKKPSFKLAGAEAYPFTRSGPLNEKEARIGRAYGKATRPVQRTVEVALDPYMEDDEPLDNIIKLDFCQSEQRASAGKGIYLDDESMITIKARAEALPSDYQRNPERYFGVPVGGNSMEPKYHDGDILIISKEPVNVGEIGVFTMEGEGYVKELGRGVLHSLNSEYEDIPLTEDVRCNGKVVGVLDTEDIFEE